jgi:hypothetical protein
MGLFDRQELEESFERFERAAARGHEDSIWIGSVLKDVEMEENALKEAFASTKKPLGYYFAAKFSDLRHRVDFYKKSAEEGCSWGQVAYGDCFRYGSNVKDKKVYVQWLEKAADQNNPQAIGRLGEWFRHRGGNDKGKAVGYSRAAVELGWKKSRDYFAEMLRDGEGCEKDLRQAVMWSAKGGRGVFWELLEDAKIALERRATEDLDCDINQVCYSLGWGLYWYRCGSEDCNDQDDKTRVFGDRCLDFYCSCIELQRKSIFTFLLSWNRTTGGVKGPGQMIGHMVWEGREYSLVQTFEESDGKEPETK